MGWAFGCSRSVVLGAAPLNRFVGLGLHRTSSNMLSAFLAVLGAAPLNRFVGLGLHRTSSNMLSAFLAVN